MKLLTMTDFVIKQKTTSTFDLPQIMWYDSEVTKLDNIRRYAQFIKQPLTLSMFVPCDEYGNYWKFPPTVHELEWAKRDSVEAEQSFKQKEYFYQKAKEKVLFEDFNLIGNNHIENNKLGLIVGIGFKNGIFQTIECLANSIHLSKNKIFLTESAIKQIGL